MKRWSRLLVTEADLRLLEALESLVEHTEARRRADHLVARIRDLSKRIHRALQEKTP